MDKDKCRTREREIDGEKGRRKEIVLRAK